MIGTLLAQMIVVVAAPVLSRLYSPEHFGALGAFTAVVSVLGVIAGLRYDVAIVPAETDADAKDLLSLSVLLSVSVSVVVGAALFAFVVVFRPTFASQYPLGMLWIAVIAAMAMASFRALNFWFNRQRKFGRLATTRVLRSASTIGTQISLGISHLVGNGLIVGAVIGHLVSLSVLGTLLLREDKSHLWTMASPKRLRSVAQRYREFPLFSLPQATLNEGSQLLPVAAAGAFFGTGALGFYWFTHRLLLFPTEVFAQSVRQVFLQRASEVVRNNKALLPSYWKSSASLLALGLLPTLALLTSGPQLFGVVFGPNWVEAGHYARWMGLWWLAKFVSPPSVVMFAVLRQQQLHFRLEIGGVLARLTAIAVGSSFGSALHLVALYSIIEAAYYLTVVGIVSHIVRRHDHGRIQRAP